MSDFKCLVCKSPYFKEGYNEISVHVDTYIHNDESNDLYTETSSDGEINFRIKSEVFDDLAEVYKYICEDCGYIMSFTKEKNVQSRQQNQEKKQKESGYDWSDFGKTR